MNYEKFLKDIMPKIEEHLIQNGRGMIVQPGYEWYRECITLYAKQHNLIESILLLLDNNMCEEAFILSRTVLNNYFMIGYLLNDKDGRRIAEYHIQPLLNRRYLLKNMKKMLEGFFGKMLKEKGKKPLKSIKTLNKEIKEIGKVIKQNGFEPGRKMLSILELAKNSDEKGFDLYALYYTEASKYEHSDITSLEIYKQSVEGVDKGLGFIMDLNSTDEKLRDKTYEIISICYLDTLSKIMELLKGQQSHLLVNYDIEKLNEITIQATNFLAR